MSNAIMLKRVYEIPEESDGMRILVDRLWPRGIRKEVAQIDEWLKDIAPSSDLRQWFNHEPDKFDAFTMAYRQQLAEDEAHQKAVQHVIESAESQPVTLVYAARDPVVNHARVLQAFIRQAAERKSQRQRD